MAALTVIISGDATRLQKEMEKISRLAAHVGGELKQHLGGKLAALASVAGIEEIGRRTIEFAEQVSIMSQRLGVSTDAVQAWDYALKQGGSSIEAAAGFFEKLAVARQKALKGDADMVQSFKNLSVSINDLRNGRIEDIALQIAKVFESGDPQKLIADLREVGGKGAGEMVAAFRSGLADLVDGARDAGVIISKEVVEKLRDAADQAKTLGEQFTAGIAPAIAALVKAAQALWLAGNVFTRAAVGFATGGVQGAKDLVQEYKDEQIARMAAEGRQKDRRNQKFVGGDSETNPAQVNREEGLEDRLDKLKEENRLKGMSKEDRLEELKAQREAADLIAKSRFLSRTERIKGAISREELTARIMSEQSSSDAPKWKAVHGQLNQYQQIGAYTGPPVLIDLNKKMEKHLASINKHLKGRAGRSRVGDVCY